MQQNVCTRMNRRGGGTIKCTLSYYTCTYRTFGGNSFIANQIGQRSTEDDRNKLTPSVLRVKVTLDGWLTKLCSFLYSLPSKTSPRLPRSEHRLNLCCRQFQKPGSMIIFFNLGIVIVSILVSLTMHTF